MRANEPAEFCKDIVPMIQKNVTRDYINQLRYERLMAKSMYFGILAYHYACEGDRKDSAKSKCDRIYRAYDARAMKIKKGM